MRYHYTPVRMANTQNTDNNKILIRMWSSRNFHSLLMKNTGVGMATHSSVLALRIPGTGEPGGLLSMGSHRVGHD